MAMNLIQARLFFKTKLMAATGGRGPLFGSVVCFETAAFTNFSLTPCFNGVLALT
jgi:hypothetical protein